MRTNIMKQIFHVLLLAALISFAFWFALKDNMQEVLENISHVSYVYLVIVIALGMLYYILQGYMLYAIGKTYAQDLTLKDGMENAFSAAFFNGVTPVGGGQVAQAYVFHKRGLSYQHIASILWKDFFLYQIVIVGFALVLLICFAPYCFQKFPQLIWLVYIGFMIDASLIFILWTMSHFPIIYTKLSTFFVRLLYKMHVVKNKQVTLTKWNLRVQYFNEEIKKLKKDKKIIGKGIVINILRQIIYYSIPFFVGLGLGLPLRFEDIFLVWLLSCCIHMMNALTPLPGDTGWTETVFIIMFGFVFNRIYASSIMILWRMATYYIPLLVGGIIFLIVKTRKKHSLLVQKNTE